MANYCCPICSAPMDAAFKKSDHPALPDRTFLHCQNKQCDLSCTTDDLPLLDVGTYKLCNTIQQRLLTAALP